MKPALTASLVLVMGLCVGANAQEYPNRSIRAVVPWPAGGSSDAVARLLGQKLAERWGQQVIVENRPGAGTTIGNDIAAKAPADGYTLLVTATGLVVSSLLYPNLPYSVEKDFSPISLMATSPSVLVVHPALPANSVRDLIALARQKPGMINYASGGSGSSDHVAGEMFKLLANVNLVHIPYKGTAPALPDLLAGNTQLMFCIAITAMPHIRSGRLRPLGVTSARRSEFLPDLPTLSEAGVTGYSFETWIGTLATGGSPPAVVTKLSGEIQKIMALPDIRDKMKGMGADPVGSTPAEFATKIQTDLSTIGKVVKVSGMKVD
jgi:tripartite-type tricarboxylate transporter receptor subunit TctC